MKLLQIFTYPITASTSFGLDTLIHTFPEIKKLSSGLKGTMHLCMYVVDSRTKQSKKWTLGALADARGSPENVSGQKLTLPTL